MDPIYLGGPKPPSEPMDQDLMTDDDDEEDQLLSDLEDSAPPPPEPPKPVVPSGQEIEPDPVDDDEPTSSGQKRKGPRKSNGLHRVPGYSALPEDRINNILEENGAAGPMSKEAIFLLSIATEEFIQRFIQAAHMFSSYAHRDVIRYDDLANATGMRCFSMLEDVVPHPKLLYTALDLREDFIKRQIAEDPALTAASDPLPLPDPHAPLVAYPSEASTPWESTPAAPSKNTTPVPSVSTPSKRQKTVPPAPVEPKLAATSSSNGKRKAKDKDKDKDDKDGVSIKERRASTRQRDKHGRFGNNPIDPRVWDHKFAPAPAAAPPQDPWANQPPASLPGPASALSAPPETPFAQTGRTIYSQR
ncbi:hypothetical protein K488DRAFT_83813 [Vararia minispora EC-137]|uniref:Uncharacterized protein n=1 Tax=Vararia minispora EC-137 TaxID=1314806 RepID=A0ACB8QRW2_9AGAM|nr:hypothetical protein K488DRAFT_83813 [Vararia minispora EC-137]